MEVSSSTSQVSQGPSSPPGQQKWWKFSGFKKDRSNSTAAGSTSSTKATVFGVPLQDSLNAASVAISQVAPDNKARVYGHVPVVVAKTGLFLKESGTTIEGVFRVSGSEKRVKDLESIFNTPPLYGKDLSWVGYTVHDAASVLRRYLNSLPEPVVPFDLYSAFQDALPRPDASRTRNQLEVDSAVNTYKGLIAALPHPSQHLLFYLLDVLGVFSRKSEVNLMPASNLATIFQPGVLRHPPDLHGPPLPPSSAPAMHVSASQSVPSSPAAPTHPPAGVSDDTSDAVKIRIQRDAQEHKRSIEVVEFLIDHQTSFELQLPQRQQTSSVSVEKSNSQQSTQSLPQAETSEKSDRSTSNLVRRSSERTAPEHARRLRRKRQARQASEDDSSATQDVAQPNMDAELGSVPEGSSVRRAKTLPAKALAPARKQRLAAAH